MASTRVLVKRRKAVRNIRKITRTMELIATARFKKALDRATEAAAYTRKIAELAADLSQSAGEVSHPLLEPRPQVRKAALLVLCSNRGLCGGYNSGIIREANGRIREYATKSVPLHLELSGNRAIAYFRFQGLTAQNTYKHFEDKPTFDEVDAVANNLIRLFVDGVVDRVDVAYQQFQNVARQTPVVETLLPFGALTAAKPATASTAAYEFAPNASEILSELVPAAFKAKLFKCFLDAAVSEQIARRVAMKMATEAAGDMIKEISREYNRARQANITKELAEIIGGAAALE
jgi:F-type H+-transporting ATPase subunit gamma